VGHIISIFRRWLLKLDFGRVKKLTFKRTNYRILTTTVAIDIRSIRSDCISSSTRVIGNCVPHSDMAYMIEDLDMMEVREEDTVLGAYVAGFYISHGAT
jgi:hypothetical protein